MVILDSREMVILSTSVFFSVFVFIVEQKPSSEFGEWLGCTFTLSDDRVHSLS